MSHNLGKIHIVPCLEYSEEADESRTSSIANCSNNAPTTVVVSTRSSCGPCGQTFASMIPTIVGHTGVSNLVVVLENATEKQFHAIKSFLRSMKHFSAGKTLRIVWSNGPRVTELTNHPLLKACIGDWTSSRGTTCWLALGYAIASGASVVTFLDSDTFHFDFDNQGKRLITNLMFPLCYPSGGIKVNQGIFRSNSGNLHQEPINGTHGNGTHGNGTHGNWGHGEKELDVMTRVFITPLISVLHELYPQSRILELCHTMEHTRYGNVALRTDVGRCLQFSPTSAPTTVFLSELSSKVRADQIMRTEISYSNEGDFQGRCVHADNSSDSISVLPFHIALVLLLALHKEGHAIDPSSIDRIVSAYAIAAKSAAGISSTSLGEHLVSEEFDGELTETMNKANMVSAQLPLLPAWDSVLAFENGNKILETLVKAVDGDSKELLF